MSNVLTILGGAMLCFATALLAGVSVVGLQWLARRQGGPRVERLTQALWFAVIGSLLGESLPLLWPVLAPWHHVVLGASFGLAWAAMRPGMSARRHD